MNSGLQQGVRGENSEKFTIVSLKSPQRAQQHPFRSICAPGLPQRIGQDPGILPASDPLASTGAFRLPRGDRVRQVHPGTPAIVLMGSGTGAWVARSVNRLANPIPTQRIQPGTPRSTPASMTFGTSGEAGNCPRLPSPDSRSRSIPRRHFRLQRTRNPDKRGNLKRDPRQPIPLSV
jgi:hypothetical protein